VLWTVVCSVGFEFASKYRTENRGAKADHLSGAATEAANADRHEASREAAEMVVAQAKATANEATIDTNEMATRQLDDEDLDRENRSEKIRTAEVVRDHAVSVMCVNEKLRDVSEKSAV
jgi:hypothetical protein